MSTVPSDGDTSDSDHKAHEDAAPERAPKSDPHIRQTDRCRQFLEDTGDISDRVLQGQEGTESKVVLRNTTLRCVGPERERGCVLFLRLRVRERGEARECEALGGEASDIDGDRLEPLSQFPGAEWGNEVRGTREGERKMKEREGGRVGEGRAGGGECKSSCNDFATRTHF
ncbi:hypothetical protein F5148DRAFT_1150289 [Russula earlei]|uniref:Uncharacterized protein n=1 Tax=Russula earlei TaxID=71964 RepID=A0ACC0U5Q5_9AGAM|nr:hypothetical protein F5148DRAFT_1150289 [Russula earlei]